MASTFIPDDTEFIYMVLRVARPDGKPPVPIWVTTEENVVCVHKGKAIAFRSVSIRLLCLSFPLWDAYSIIVGVISLYFGRSRDKNVLPSVIVFLHVL